MDIEFVRSVDETPIGEWGELAERAGHVFATPEWLLTWWRNFGRSGRPLSPPRRSPTPRADRGRVLPP